ncbi:membrane protein insertase YidC [Candidatus Uhrbacteria bacterium]|nr:membrane protein insertase YidC [Candidatus Uhrbacteria bacterium]
MKNFFNAILYQPLFNLLIALTNFAGGNIGWGIVLITIGIRALLYPLTQQSLLAQRSMQKLQPAIAALKEKHKGDKERFSRELMTLYQHHKVNPFSSCLTVLVQLPILWALYQVLNEGIANQGTSSALLYSFVSAPTQISSWFLGVDLSKPSIIIAAIAGVFQYLQARTLPKPPIGTQPSDGAKDEQMMSIMNKQMMYVFPIVTVIIGMRISSGLTLYWALSTALLYLQQIAVLKKQTSEI